MTLISKSLLKLYATKATCSHAHLRLSLFQRLYVFKELRVFIFDIGEFIIHLTLQQ